MESFGVTDILAWLTAIFFALAYRLFFRACDFWETQKVKTTNSSFLAALSAKQLHQQELKNYNKFGRVYGRYDSKMPVLTIGDPDILKDIFNSDAFPNRRDIRFGDEIMDRMISALEGKDWDRIHRIVSKCFTPAKLAAMAPKIKACTDVLCNNIDMNSRGDGSIDVNRFVSCYMIDVIGNCVFDAGIKSNENPNNPFVVHTKKLLLSDGFNWRGLLAVYFPRVMKWLNISLFNPEGSLFFKNFIHEWLKVCKHENRVNDVSFLKFVTEEEKADLNQDPEQFSNTMSETELAAQCCIFFMAGYHATNSTLASVLYSLAINPDVQERLYDEIKELKLTCDKCDSKEYIDAINDMKYLDAVINETLRMYPATVRTERRAERDYTISGLNISLQKGMLVSIPIYAMHHDSEWYPDPEKFNPNRFYKPNFVTSLRLYKENCKYMPFGQGKRICLGMRFALFQLKLGLVQLLSKYKFQISPETTVPLELTAEYALLKPKNLILGVEHRREV